MSIASEITRINSNIVAAYTAAENKGATMPLTSNSANLADTIDSIPQGGSAVERKDVNFYDYDGTLLYSYTTQQAQALLSLPPLPSHSGLIAQQWNWTLEDIQSYLGSGREITVGCNYDTYDGATRFYMFVKKGTRIPKLSIYFGLNKLSSATVYWGDGTSSVVENTNTYVRAVAAVKTDYTEVTEDTELCVTISGRIEYLGSGVSNYSLFSGGDTPLLTRVNVGSDCQRVANSAFCESTSLREISLPSTIIHFYNSGFSGSYNLRFFTFPRGTGTIAENLFYMNFRLELIAIPVTVTTIERCALQECYSLKSVFLPDTVRTIGINSFSACYALRSIVLPSNLSSLAETLFYYNISLAYIKIPASVTSIGSGGFMACKKLYAVDLTLFTDPTHIPALMSNTVFNKTPDYLRLYVASQAMLEAFAAATNWSNYADRYVIKGAAA